MIHGGNHIPPSHPRASLTQEPVMKCVSLSRPPLFPKLTPQQEKAYVAILDFDRVHGRLPLPKELARQMNMPFGAHTYRIYENLVEAGALVRQQRYALSRISQEVRA